MTSARQRLRFAYVEAASPVHAMVTRAADDLVAEGRRLALRAVSDYARFFMTAAALAMTSAWWGCRSWPGTLAIQLSAGSWDDVLVSANTSRMASAHHGT